MTAGGLDPGDRPDAVLGVSGAGGPFRSGLKKRERETKRERESEKKRERETERDRERQGERDRERV